MRRSAIFVSAALCSAFAIHTSYAALLPDLSNNADFKGAISLSTETVSDRVDYSPNLDGGGFAAPDKRSRYQSARVEYAHQHTPDSLLTISLSQRQINNVRDTFQISQLEADGFIRLTPLSDRYSVDLAFGALFNYSDQLSKNSYTTYDGNLITRSSIDNPQDQSLSFNLIGGRKLGRGFSIRALTGGGVVRSDHDSVNGVGRSSNGCQYAFSANGTGGSLDQIGACGDVVSYQQTFATEEGVGGRLGFRPSQDIAYLARFVQTGAQFNWSSRRFSASLGYRYRRYFRGTLDQNIEAAGRTPVRVSQLLDAEFSYNPSSQWRLSLAATYHSAPFLDDVPLLYTAFTSDRYHEADALSFRLGISWYFGRKN